MSRQRTDAELLSDAHRDQAAFGELHARPSPPCTQSSYRFSGSSSPP
jgi:hypothetical protein